jgi:hypothetical protein
MLMGPKEEEEEKKKKKTGYRAVAGSVSTRELQRGHDRFQNEFISKTSMLEKLEAV